MASETKIADLRGMDAAKLKDELLRLKKEQFNLRFQQATGQLEKASRMRDVRRQIARVLTVLNQKTPAKTA
jgi:large subunit ribosomal protein L29